MKLLENIISDILLIRENFEDLYAHSILEEDNLHQLKKEVNKQNLNSYDYSSLSRIQEEFVEQFKINFKRKELEYYQKFLNGVFNKSLRESNLIEEPQIDKSTLNRGIKKDKKILKNLNSYFKENEVYEIKEIINTLNSIKPKLQMRIEPEIPLFGKYIPPADYNEIEKELYLFQDEILNKDLNPIEKAIHMHFHFVRINPFIESNGRSARVFSNSYLKSNNFFPPIIDNKERLFYARLLEPACIARKEQGLDNIQKLTDEEDLFFTYLASKIRENYMTLSKRLPAYMKAFSNKKYK